MTPASIPPTARSAGTTWRPTADGQADREAGGLPRTHRLTLLPGMSRRVGRLQGPLRGLLVDG